MRRIIGIDNGVSGAITILDSGRTTHCLMPVKKCLDYTKKKNWLNRVDVHAVKKLLSKDSNEASLAVIERPMVNPARWKATMSAIRCLEATLIILEDLQIPYRFIDSKEWQKVMLPSGLHKDELKEASCQVARRIFPTLEFKKEGADSLLIAEYAKRTLS
jgi:hypothetical protein